MSIDDFCVQLSIFGTTIDHLQETTNICQLLADYKFEFVASEVTSLRVSHNSSENLLDEIIRARKFEVSDYGRVEEFVRWVESKPSKCKYDGLLNDSAVGVPFTCSSIEPNTRTKDSLEECIGDQNMSFYLKTFEQPESYCNDFSHGCLVPSVSNDCIVPSEDTLQNDTFDTNFSRRNYFNDLDNFTPPSPLHLSGLTGDFNLSMTKFVDQHCDKFCINDYANFTFNRSNDCGIVEDVMKDLLDNVSSLLSSQQFEVYIPNVEDDDGLSFLSASDMDFLEMEPDFYDTASYAASELSADLSLANRQENCTEDVARKMRKRKRLFTPKKNQVRCRFPECNTCIVVRHRQDKHRLIRHIKNHACEVFHCSHCDFRSLRLRKVKSHHRLQHADHHFSSCLKRDELCRSQLDILVKKCFPDSKL